MQRIAILACVLLVLSGAACASIANPAPNRQLATAPSSSNSTSSIGSAESRSLASDAAASAPAAPAAGQSGQTLPLPSLDRMIVRTVNLTLAVASVQQAVRDVERLAAEQGGLIAASQVRQDGDRFTATLTVRVPADSATYATTMERLRTLAERVVDEQVQSQDVTEEYVDLDARLRTLRLSEERLLALYDKAQRIEEIFAIQRELTGVRGQIEQAQGRHQALERRAALTTINLTLRESAAARAPGDWSPLGVAAEAWQAFAVALRGTSTALIWALVWLPLYGLPLLALWLLRRWLRANVRRTAR